MNVAIIDIGSNNIKLEIHEVESSGATKLLFAEKVSARLGHAVFFNHHLQPENQQTAIDGLKQFGKMIKSFSCKKTVAVGTAALRETKSENFVMEAYQQSGIQIDVIPGVEEARLVYLGALAHVPFNGRTMALIDIGGGSTEVSISTEKEILFSESFHLGTVRLKEMFEDNSHRKLASLVSNYVRKVVEPFLSEIKANDFSIGLCTGGTAKNLSEMLSLRGKVDQENGNAIIKSKSLRALVDEMIDMKPDEIKKIPGLDKARADIILPGALLLSSLFDLLEIKKSIISSKGLRDGVLSNFVHKKVDKKIYLKSQEFTKTDGLEAISKKFNIQEKHAKQCAKLAINLFDLILNGEPEFEEVRDILYGAALLHDIGIFIDYASHHKHSYYLIENSDIKYFSDREKHLMALIARYHRRGLPKKSHWVYELLEPKEKEIVAKMAALVRLADALDRSYTSSVKELIIISKDEDSIRLGVKSNSDISLELWSFGRKKDFFEKAFKIKIDAEKI